MEVESSEADAFAVPTVAVVDAAADDDGRAGDVVVDYEIDCVTCFYCLVVAADGW